jgi:diguanylate cyclase (GGDEF)-like protein
MAIPLKLAYDALRIPELERATVTDARTGLANSSGFDAQFGDELERAKRFARPMSLAMLDLDYLNAVNDQYEPESRRR